MEVPPLAPALKIKEGGQYVYYKCDCAATGETGMLCRLLKTRQVPGLQKLQYYVQFIECNGRVDDWYDQDRICVITDEDRKAFEHAIRDFAEKEAEVRTINRLNMGGHEMEVWYYVPLSEELQQEDVYCCEFCLGFQSNRRAYERHMERCRVRVPPGTEIYRDDRIAFFELDGQQQKRYCRNICYLARMFLQHKTLHTDVDLFYFYVMYARVDPGRPDYRLVGYFSKEKQLQLNNVVTCNILSCILSLPCYQSKGYGGLLIDMAYMLAARDNLIGSPEKPLSDLGYIAFSRYWKYRILEYMTEHQANCVSIADIVRYTNFTALDIQQTLRNEKILFPRRTGDFVFYLTEEKMHDFMAQAQRQEQKAWRLQDKFLHYCPCALMQREAKPELDKIKVYVRPIFEK